MNLRKTSKTKCAWIEHLKLLPIVFPTDHSMVELMPAFHILYKLLWEGSQLTVR